MKTITTIGKIALAAIALFSGAACSQRHNAGNPQPTIDAFTECAYRPQYASGIAIDSAAGSRSVVLTTLNPWQGADSTSTSLFIARGGESAPADFNGEVIEGEARRIVAMSSTHIAMLDALGAIDRVVGVSGIDYIANPAIRAGRDTIGDVGFEGNINYELLVSLNPDIVLLYGVSGASLMEGKLRELGIPFAYIGDYLEESPLGKAEWLVAVGEIIGRRQKGIEIFNPIIQRYNELCRLKTDSHTPTVMLNAPYGDSWFMPSANSYMVRLISDARARSAYDRDTGSASAPIDLEEAYALASRSDFWLNCGPASSLDELTRLCPKFTDVKCVTRGAVYNNNKRLNSGGGNDFFESAVVNPDIVLRDLISIFHPEALPGPVETVYYRQLR